MTGLLPSSELALTALLSAGALVAVWLPLLRGLRVCLQARNATRRVGRGELRDRLQEPQPERSEPIGVLMARVLAQSLRDDADAHPREFVLDATKQYVINEYEAHFSRPISMYANLLPPIGFIGTTSGLLVLFLAMHTTDSTLELGALALALTSSIFALIGFAFLEGLKIRLYGRLLECLDVVASLERSARGGRARTAAAAATPG